MYTALESIKKDPSFANEKLLEITAPLDEAKDPGMVDHSKQATIFDAVAAAEPQKSAA